MSRQEREWYCIMARHERYNDNYEFEDISSFSSHSAYRRSRAPKRKKRKGLKAFLSVLCVLLVLVGGGMFFVSHYLLGGLSTTTITKDKEALGISEDTMSDPKVTNIALFGVDSRGDDFSGRSDAIIVLSIDEIHNKVKMTSLLRDSRVYMGEDYGYTDTGYDKLNHAYAFGGAEYAIRVINQNFGLDIQNYVTVNFNKLAGIVDAVGGIDIEISEAEAEQININLEDLAVNDDSVVVQDSDYIYESGMVHLNGNQAVAYSRIRNLDGDDARAERQQTVISAVMTRLTTMSKLEYPSMINQISSLCETSMSTGEIMGFIPFAMGGFTIENLVIPGEYEGLDSDFMENGGWMWTYDTDVAAEHMRSFIYEDSSTQTE